jgi:hypothetical protein
MRRHAGGRGCGARAGETNAPPPPGRPWVAVRPHYGGPPFGGLDAARTKAGESLPDRVSQKPPGSAPGSYGPGDRKAAMERREAPASFKRGCGKTERPGAPLGAPSPRFLWGEKKDDGVPRAVKE